MQLENEEKCTYCREYGNLPCDECNKKLEEKNAMNKYMPFINIPIVEMKSSKLKPMNKTKYIKVAVEERLPSEQGTYMVIFKDNKVGKFNFWNEEGFKDSWNEHVNFWFEEIPDREEEMIEMLERVFNLCDKLQFPTEKQLSDLKTEIKSLLQELNHPLR